MTVLPVPPASPPYPKDTLILQKVELGESSTGAHGRSAASPVQSQPGEGGLRRDLGRDSVIPALR